MPTAKSADRGETLTILEITEMMIDGRLSRAADAAEDAAKALGRIADAFETFNALFASVIGVGRAVCGSDRSARFEPVHFVRSGGGQRSFPCDSENSGIVNFDKD